MLRTLLVDDEEPARERLQRLLADHADVELIGEAHDGEQAIERIMELRPDLVFLDIQMPGCSGMEVVASLPTPRPKIVFCTAFDRYAVDAFELRAVDYLLKPVHRARLARALETVRGLAADDADARLDRVTAAEGAYPRRFLARHGSRYRVVPVDDVVYFRSEDGLTRLQTAEQNFWMQPTLAEMEQRLDPARFFRLSRAAIVNLEAVREVVPAGGGHGEAELRNGERLEISRRRFKPLIEAISG